MSWCRNCTCTHPYYGYTWNCDKPRWIGEWFAITAIDWVWEQMGKFPPFDWWSKMALDWGRDIPKPPEGCTYDKYCTKLPWGEILYHTFYYRAGDFAEPWYHFDYGYALNHAPKWQVSIYWDNNYTLDPYGYPYGGDRDDYYNWSWDVLDITDWLPSLDCNKADGEIGDGGLCHFYQNKYHCCMDLMAGESEDTICQADLDGDGKVFPGDAMILLSEWKRKDCPCGP